MISAEEKKAFYLFLKGYTLREVKEATGLSRSQIQKIRSEAVKHMEPPNKQPMSQEWMKNFAREWNECVRNIKGEKRSETNEVPLTGWRANIMNRFMEQM